MVVDVIDIRKRIEKIRNEVSEAIVSRHEFEAHEEALREDINLKNEPLLIVEALFRLQKFQISLFQ